MAPAPEYDPADIAASARYVRATFGGRRVYIQVTTQKPGLLGGLEVDRCGDPVERKVPGGYSRNMIIGHESDFENVVEYRMNRKYAELVRLRNEKRGAECS